MKKRVAIVLAMAVLMLVVGTSSPALAWGPRTGRTIGAVKYTMELYAPYPTIVWAPAWFTVYAVGVDPWVEAEGQVHTAEGRIRLAIYHESTGWLTAENEIQCMQFGEDADGRFALITSEVVAQQGLGDSVLGTFWVHKLHDNAMPGRDGDFFSYFAGDAFPGWSFDPVCTVPDAYLDGLLYGYPVERGDLVIRP